MITNPIRSVLPLAATEDFGATTWLDDDDLDNINAISADDFLTLVKQIRHTAMRLQEETAQRVAQIDAMLVCIKDELEAED